MTRLTRTRRRDADIGSSSLRLRPLLAVILPVLLLLGMNRMLDAAGKKKSPQAYALIAGTVFRDTGFTLPGAEVTLTPAPGEKPAARMKPMKTVSDARGEYAFRVPAVPMRYNVGVKAPGFRALEKLVSVAGDERIDAFFHLEAEAKD